MDAAVRGDENARRQVSEAACQHSVKECRRWELNNADADDVQSQVSMLVVKSLPTFQGRTRADFAAWVRTIARRTIYRKIREKYVTPVQGRGTEPPSPAGTDPVEAALAREIAGIAAECLKQMKSDDQEVVLGRIANVSFAVLAKVLEMTEGAVRQRHHRAREQLADCIKRRAEPPEGKRHG